MTHARRLGKQHMFLWGLGQMACFSSIGAALVPILATLRSHRVLLGGRHGVSGRNPGVIRRTVLPSKPGQCVPSRHDERLTSDTGSIHASLRRRAPTPSSIRPRASGTQGCARRNSQNWIPLSPGRRRALRDYVKSWGLRSLFLRHRAFAQTPMPAAKTPARAVRHHPFPLQAAVRTRTYLTRTSSMASARGTRRCAAASSWEVPDLQRHQRGAASVYPAPASNDRGSRRCRRIIASTAPWCERSPDDGARTARARVHRAQQARAGRAELTVTACWFAPRVRAGGCTRSILRAAWFWTPGVFGGEFCLG